MKLKTFISISSGIMMSILWTVHCIQYAAILCIFVLSLKSLRNNALKATVEAPYIYI